LPAAVVCCATDGHSEPEVETANPLPVVVPVPDRMASIVKGGGLHTQLYFITVFNVTAKGNKSSNNYDERPHRRGRTQNAPSPRDPGPQLIHVSLGTPEFTHQTALDWFSRSSTAHGCVCPTDGHTHRERGTSVTMGRTFALCASDAA